MKKRLSLALLFLALILIALPGFAVKAIRRATRAAALRPAG
jgi:hypothetical protein